MKYITKSGSALELGGKVYGLMRLQAEGFLVPEWFAISPQAFDDSLDRYQKAVLERGNIEEIRSALDDVIVSHNVVAEISTALQELSPGHSHFAVRSSALEEDAADRSFAGQLESYLSVTCDGVVEKVAAVWRSGFSERLLAYRDGNGRSRLPKRAPAVIVQRMVDAGSSGVAFSADPLSGRWGVAVISAVWGLGTALVSGDSDADLYEIDRTGAILRAVVARKKIRHCCHAGSPRGVSACNVPSAEQNTRVLSDQQIHGIAAVVRQIARHMRQPQDVEWAIENGALYVLQTRPITTMRDLPDPDALRNIWDNSNITESYSGVTTPLTFSFVRAAYEAVYREFCRTLKVAESAIADNEHTFQQMLGLIRGRIYYNLLNWYRVLALLPGFAANRWFMEQSLGVKERLPADIANTLAVYTVRARVCHTWQSGRTIAALMWNYCVLGRKIKRFYDRVNRTLADSGPCIADMRLDELAEYYHKLRSQLLTAWDAPVLNDFFTMIFHGLLKRLSQRWLAANELANELVRAKGEMVSVEPAARLREMAAIAARNSQLVQVLRRGELAESLREIRQVPALGERYDAYLERFGERCLEELKLESPTLHEDPALLLRSIGELAYGITTMRVSGVGDSSTAAEQRIRRAFRLHPLRNLIFRWVLWNARERIRSRENLRFERTRVFGRVRRIFIEIGNRLHALDRLDDARDILFLQIEEVLGFINGTAVTVNLRELVALRKREFKEIRTQPSPADRFETYGPVYQGNKFQPNTTAIAFTASGDERYGFGSCAGRVRGRVCVIKEPRMSSLPVGSILVAEHTDPGWIMLFAGAAGLIVERGSLLSHSAIVSREIGLPSVVSVPEATRWLRDGDLVEIDGEKGIVRKLPSEETHG